MDTPNVITKESFLDFITFCDLHFGTNYALVGSITDYFYVNIPLTKVRDIDILLENSDSSYVESFPEVYNWKWQGDSRYIGEKKSQQSVYKSNLKLTSIFEIDWIFGTTVNTKQTVEKVEFENFEIKISSRNSREEILRKIINGPSPPWWIAEKKLRYEMYKK